MSRSGVVAIDQGTTSSRAILFDNNGRIVHTSQREFTQYYPGDGWVEHSPQEIIDTVVQTTRDIIEYATSHSITIAGVGITNQRETTVVWNRKTGEPVYNAIVWQDRRTAEQCTRHREDGYEDDVSQRTGLLLDPYFSASKVAWILDNVEGARTDAENGQLAFGTIDSFLIYKLTGGRYHVTDATNASRTSLFNIRTHQWDDELLRLFNVPESVLPDVLDCIDEFGVTNASILGLSLPIFGVAGDQQAAAIGQGCFEVGSIKSTYGTGCFVLSNTGDNIIHSKNKLLSTIAYRFDGKTTFALEGSIFVAGAAVQWLRDELRIIEDAADTEELAISLDGNDGVYLVPAFTGLGAPHWNPNARGSISGLTRATGRAHLARAALESVCYQTVDLLDAIRDDGASPSTLKVDGGMIANNWLSQFLADITELPVVRAPVLETTALGAARLAGVKAGVYENLVPGEETADHDNRHFFPGMESAARESLLYGWREAVKKTLQ